ncbi:hypothetical protein MMC24_001405 [Lignoscripta atroalba]|nr:hypothetical protein [Lignoscripta atroalba]
MVRLGKTALSPQQASTSTPFISSSATHQTSMTSAGPTDPTSTISDHDDAQHWRNRQTTRSPLAASVPKLLKIKSSPSHGALAAAMSAPSHAKLHKRGSSGSSVASPQTVSFPAFDPHYSSASAFPQRITPPITYEDVYTPPSPSSTARSKVKIKPLLRKLASQEKNSIDLSRSAAENEGLGIYASSTMGGTRGGADVTYNTGKRGYHARTTSGTSQISTTTTSSNHRAGTQYVHPMRQTPRPYTPPLAHSYQNSLTSSEMSAPKSANTLGEGQHSYSQTRDPSLENNPLPYAPLPSAKRTPPPLHLRTTSGTHLTSTSQTNIPGTPSSLRLHTESLTSPDAMPQTSRSSLESAFRKRSRTDTNTDPAAQAAAVLALRAEFNAREAAKDLKIQQAAARAYEREAKRRERRDESARRKLEAQGRKRARSNAASEKSVPLSTGGHSTPAVFSIDMQDNADYPRRTRAATATSATKAVSSQWSLFWFKFKTMWLKFKRGISLGSSDA